MKIAVIGNGFDIASGLKSSYLNFFEFRKTKIEEFYNVAIEFLNENLVFEVEFEEAYEKIKLPRHNEDPRKDIAYYRSFDNNDLFELDLIEHEYNEQLKEKVNLIYSNIKELNKDKITFWELNLYCNFLQKDRNIDWCCIEKHIGNVIKSPGDELFDIGSILCLDFEKHCPLPVYDEYNGCEYISETTDFFYNRSKEAILKRMILGANEDENIYGLLYKHLLSFEKLFMNYISLEFKRVTDNLTNAKIYCDNFTNIYAIK